MHTYIALLRGINVGGRNSLPMAELVETLQQLGYHAVRTYIQSGNAVFRSATPLDASHAEAIAEALAQAKGFRPEVLLLSRTQLAAALAAAPFPSEEGKALHLFFLVTPVAHADLARLDALKAASERYALDGQTFYLYAPDGIGRSKLASGLERTLGVATTARNWNTLQRIAALAEG